ncbi:hypothetical protein N1851_022262 [Merluccius polli]|uniref:Uncharacterized protein n=1 Tax=Merluccius polli TaxID=89951 RepID=A0AA47NW05_MERPO|nr:hypothetical protein N1851_022262 [Merluccius polli]
MPMTAVEGIERKVNKHLRKWLGIPPSFKFQSVGLYIRLGQLQLPLSSVVEEFKVAKCRAVMMLKDSTDEMVRGAGVTTRSGRKWAADRHVERAESMLKLKDVIGNPCMGRQGLGSTHFQQWTKADPRQRSDMVQAEVRQLEEEGRWSRAVELGVQGAWTKWDLPKHKITWPELWRLEPFRISFLLRSVYDTLPTPTNLHRRYGKSTNLNRDHPSPSIQFIREGEKPSSSKKTKKSLLQTAPAWEMRVDLGRKLHFPQVVQTSLRPDMVIWSEEAKKVILIELTVSWEDGCSEAHER